MYVGVEVDTQEVEAIEAPEAEVFPVSTAAFRLLPKHAEQLRALRPNTKVTIRVSGTVQELTLAAEDGVAGVGAELSMLVTELSASRGSEFEELLDGE